MAYGDRYLDKRVDGDSLRIIGAEFTIDLANGTNEEMEMFVPHGLLLVPRSYPHGGLMQPKITFHTTIGDYSIGGRNNGQYCPW